MMRVHEVETTAATLVWAGAIAYSLYSLYLCSNSFNGSNVLTDYHYGDLARGWFGRLQDVSDFEWSCWTRLTFRLTPWLLINLLVGLFGRSSVDDKLLVPLSQSLVSLLAIAHILSRASAGLFLLIILSFHAATYLRKPVVICILAWAWRRYIPSYLLARTDDDLYLIEVAGSWFIIRCLVYSFEVLRVDHKSLPLFMGYALYLPVAFCGPILSFSGFLRNTVRVPKKRLNFHLLYTFIFSMARCTMWFLFTGLALHFVYPNAILLRPYMVVGMTLWQLAGLGIAMGHFFHLKYVVFYGMPSCWSAAEGFPTPPSPCCVSRVYLYSVMWRRFDPGLYAFLVRNIYVPILKMLEQRRLLSKTAGSVACFLFVYVWHGEQLYVLYWVVLNFTAVTIEGLSKEFTRLPAVRIKIHTTLSKGNQRRLHCLLAAPLHYFSMLSNYFFIGSMDIGKIFFQRAIRETFVNNLYILFVLYGAAQACLSIENGEKEKENRRRRDMIA